MKTEDHWILDVKMFDPEQEKIDEDEFSKQERKLLFELLRDYGWCSGDEYCWKFFFDPDDRETMLSFIPRIWDEIKWVKSIEIYPTDYEHFESLVAV